MAPLTTFIFKVASRCNLDCDYCYVYHHADQSWRTRPRFMPLAVAESAAKRISEHALTHGLDHILIALHGGEPTLAGPIWTDAFCKTVRRTISDSIQIDFTMQSNATMLSLAWLPILRRHRIRIGVSLDGPRAANDLHRRDFAGRSSYDATVSGINLLRDNAPDAFAGVLCVVDLNADPLAVYEHLSSFDPPMIDFNLPDGHWDNPPPGIRGSGTPYGDWLVAVFDAWAAAPAYLHSIRFFQDIIGLSVGVENSIESLGLAPVTLVVVESDGSIEAVDTLKTTFDGAPDLGLNVLNDHFDQALTAPLVASRQLGKATLSDPCQSCDLVTVCGGGYLPHRYSQANGFRNPSVYCRDLQVIIRHVQRRSGIVLT
ncbi:MAG TPA: FxsB family radical SAM/SPASM domain protein [Micromonosporaceae bacterium]|nr:FxsB family radical SAM/SPASM domain protein [Micromonosporaceae bacterium]HCU50117.1 FxsB family radical SAM/SPASM domain protein [Micromonosporaceae bacterium]